MRTPQVMEHQILSNRTRWVRLVAIALSPRTQMQKVLWPVDALRMHPPVPHLGTGVPAALPGLYPTN